MVFAMRSLSFVVTVRLARTQKPLKALEGPPHDLGQYYLLMDPGVSGEIFKRLQQVDGAVALDKGARMPGQGRREQDPVELENTVWELTLTLAGLK